MSSYRRPKHHTYDYNFKVGESSYKDMLDYLDKKEGRRAASPPPGKKTFAERFAEKPFYGEPKPLKLHQSSPPPPLGQRMTAGERLLADRRAKEATLSPRPERRRPLKDQDDFKLPERPRRPVPDEDTLEMDPEELIASIRRGRAKRLELLNSLEAEEGEEASSASRRRPKLRLSSEDPDEESVSSRLRQLRLADDREAEGVAASSSRAALSSSASYSASSKQSTSSRMQSSSTTTSRSVHYE